MITHSAWKARVVLGIVSTLISWVCGPVYAQPSSGDPFMRPVTFTCVNMRFEDVIQQLRKQTHLHFIYSSSIVRPEAPVSFSVHHRPLQEVLDLLGQKMNITFRKQGDYIIVKKGKADPSVLSVKSLSPAQKKQHGRHPETGGRSGNIRESEDLLAEEQRMLMADRRASAISRIRESDAIAWGPSLVRWDSSRVLKNFPPVLAVPGSYRRKKNWFATGGVFVNSYSVGAETRVGTRGVYAVLNVSLLEQGVHRIGYGLGASRSLKPGFFASLDYTFGTVTQTQDPVHFTKGKFEIVKGGYTMTGHHHQLRFMMNYNLSKRISARIGPSFNFLNTKYTFPAGNRVSAGAAEVVPAPSMIAGSYGMVSRTANVQYLAARVVAIPSDYRVIKTWVNFEAGLSYRLQFSLRK